MTLRAPEPPLTDGVVTLRPWGEEGDVEALVAACNDRAIAEFLDIIPQPYTEADAREFISRCQAGWEEGRSSVFAVTLEGEPVGSLGVVWLAEETAEIGYWIAASARGRGLCTRAVRLASRWAVEEESAQRLQLRADELNRPSIRVAEKAGFTREGVLRSSRYNARLGRRIDFAMYSLLPGEL